MECFHDTDLELSLCKKRLGKRTWGWGMGLSTSTLGPKSLDSLEQTQQLFNIEEKGKSFLAVFQAEFICNLVLQPH